MKEPTKVLAKVVLVEGSGLKVLFDAQYGDLQLCVQYQIAQDTLDDEEGLLATAWEAVQPELEDLLKRAEAAVVVALKEYKPKAKVVEGV